MRVAPIVLVVQVTALTLLAAAWALDLPRADLRVPFGYATGGDALFHLMMDKTVAETGGFLVNPRLGAPGVMNLADFPYAEGGMILSVGVLDRVTGDPFLAANLFYLGGFVAAAWAGLFALRALGVPGQVAAAGAVLFAFLPYHFWRGPFHPHLAAYYPVPLFALVAAWLCAGEALFVTNDGGRIRRSLTRGRTLPALVACGLTALGGPYHAAFGLVLIAAGGLIGWLRRPSWDRLIDPLAAGVLVLAGFLATVAPYARAAAREGWNPVAAYRPVGNYYQYSLRIVNLLKPVPGHRLPPLRSLGLPPERTRTPADLTWLYNEMNEAEVAPPLGLLGSLGFLALVALALAAPCPLTRSTPALGDLGKLNLAALLVGLLGGFGEVVALYVTMKLRGYNRISVVIGFLSLAGLALLVGRAGAGTSSSAPSPRRRWGFLALVWGVTTLGLLDQVPPLLTPDHARDAAAFRDDRAFFARVEAALPAGSMVFQLPPNSFPEFGRHFGMYDYDHFRGYLHTRRLRWSYGALRGRPAERLHSRLAPLPPSELVDQLIGLGFSAVYVNRKGHESGGDALVRALRDRLGVDPLVNGDGTLLVFPLPAKGA